MGGVTANSTGPAHICMHKTATWSHLVEIHVEMNVLKFSAGGIPLCQSCARMVGGINLTLGHYIDLEIML